MMLIITLITLIIVLLVLIIGINDASSEGTLVKIVIGLFLIVSSIALGTIIQDNISIDPIEVYRGNTTMSIKYEILDGDTTKCDTIISRKINF